MRNRSAKNAPAVGGGGVVISQAGWGQEAGARWRLGCGREFGLQNCAEVPGAELAVFREALAELDLVARARGQVRGDQEQQLLRQVVRDLSDLGFRVVHGVDQEQTFVFLIGIELQPLANDGRRAARRDDVVRRTSSVVVEPLQDRVEFIPSHLFDGAVLAEVRLQRTVGHGVEHEQVTRGVVVVIGPSEGAANGREQPHEAVDVHALTSQQLALDYAEELDQHRAGFGLGDGGAAFVHELDDAIEIDGIAEAHGRRVSVVGECIGEEGVFDGRHGFFVVGFERPKVRRSKVV